MVALLTLVLIVGMTPLGVFADNSAQGASAAGTVTVYIDFEGYNLGQGFYIEPTMLELPEGSSVADATATLLEQKGMEGHYTSAGNYLSKVIGIDAGKPAVTIPSYITDNGGPTTSQARTVGKENQDRLGEFDYHNESGWMYSVDHVFVGVGIKECTLKDGDVIRWQFTVAGYGRDMGVETSGMGSGEPFYAHADKTALIRALFAGSATDATRQAAKDVLINPLATAGAVGNALYDLSVDKTALQTAIAEAKTKVQDSYTVQTWAPFAAALADAEAKAGSRSATQQEVDAATLALVTAAGNLTEVPPEPGDLIGLAFASNAAGTTSLALSQGFSPARVEYGLVLPNTSTNVYVRPQTRDAEAGYKWRWKSTSNADGSMLQSEADLEFGNDFVRIGNGAFSVGRTVQIQVVSAAGDTVLKTYTVNALPKALLASLTIRYGGGATLTPSPSFNTNTQNYTGTLNLATVYTPHLNINPNSYGATDIKVNGQAAVKNTNNPIRIEDIAFDANGVYEISVEVSGTQANCFEPVAYSIKLNKPPGVSSTWMDIRDSNIFLGAAQNPSQLSINSVVADSPVTYQWYSNTVKSDTDGIAIEGATKYSYNPTKTEVGVTYYYGIATAQSGKSLKTNIATVKIIPNEAAEVVVDTPGTTLPEIDGLTWPDGVEKGFYYSESVAPGDFTRISVTPSFQKAAYDLSAAPWDCVFQYRWSRTNAVTGETQYVVSTNFYPDQAGIQPTMALGGWYYTCEVKYWLGTGSNGSTYTSDPIYVHIEDPVADGALAKQLSGLAFSKGADGSDPLPMSQAFDGGTDTYVVDAALIDDTRMLFAKVGMDDADGYRWTYSIANNAGQTTMYSTKREFGSSCVNLGGLQSISTGDYTIRIKIVGAGDDDTVYGVYTAHIVPRANLTGLSVSGAGSLMYPTLFRGRDLEYWAFVDTAQPTLYITPSTNITTHEIKVNGQEAASYTQFLIDTSQLVFDANDECKVTVGLSNPNGKKYWPQTYTLTLRKIPATVKFTVQSLPGYSKFLGNTDPHSFSVNAQSSAGPVSYQWYRKDVLEGSAWAPVDGATRGTYTPPKDVAGIFHYYCVASNGTDSLASQVGVVMVYPQTNLPELSILTPGEALPDI
jgi:hypothetical protein